MADKPKKRGRPTKFKPDMIDTLNAMGHEGESLAEMALTLGVSRVTFNDWCASNPNFLYAVKAAQARSQVVWERIAMKQAREGTGNATALIFQMKNRFTEDYRDKQEIETEQKGEQIHVIKWEGVE
tara:strand:+ start:367 stop:744 length:378 start_codon:yes stop_codon:yes gene_type:complete